MNILKSSALTGLIAVGIAGVKCWSADAESEGSSIQKQRPGTQGVQPTKSETPLFRPDGHQIAPYLVDRQPDRLHIAWRTAAESPSTIELLWGGKTVESQSTAAAYHHSTVFDGLRADTIYEYRVPGCRPCFVRTAPADDERTFAIIGHTHGSEHMSHYPDTLLAARVTELQPDYVVHAGDCVYYSAPGDWNKNFFRPFGELLSVAPVHISPGNHDVGWPFMYGYDMRLFRELFPVPYPEAVGSGAAEAFYSIQHGNVEFFFLSYVANMTLDGVQVPWLLAELERSEADFKVVVFGGINGYYDKDAFLDLIEGTSVDAIVNGDGPAPKKSLDRSCSTPRFVVGGTTGTATPWLACRSTANSLILKEMSADGATRSTYIIHRRSEGKVKVALGEVEGKIVKDRVLYNVELEEPISSADVGAMRFELKAPHEAAMLGYVFFDVACDVKRTEGGFRSQFARVEPEQTTITVEVPLENPFRQGHIEIEGVRIYFSSKPLLDPEPLQNVRFIER